MGLRMGIGRNIEMVIWRRTGMGIEMGKGMAIRIRTTIRRRASE